MSRSRPLTPPSLPPSLADVELVPAWAVVPAEPDALPLHVLRSVSSKRISLVFDAPPPQPLVAAAVAAAARAGYTAAYLWGVDPARAPPPAALELPVVYVGERRPGAAAAWTLCGLTAAPAGHALRMRTALDATRAAAASGAADAFSTGLAVRGRPAGSALWPAAAEDAALLVGAGAAWRAPAVGAEGPSPAATAALLLAHLYV